MKKLFTVIFGALLCLSIFQNINIISAEEYEWNIKNETVYHYGDTNAIESIKINVNPEKYKYKQYNGEEWKDIKTVPTTAGRYQKVAVYPTGTANQRIEFSIEPVTITPIWKFKNNGGATYKAGEVTQANIEYDGFTHGVGNMSYEVDYSSNTVTSELSSLSNVVNRTKTPNVEVQDVGEYTFTLEIKDEYKDKYKLADGTDTFTVKITRKPITIVWSDGKYETTKNYKNKVFTPQINVEETNKALVSGEELDYVVHCYSGENEIELNQAKDAGSYTYKVTLKSKNGTKASNYRVKADSDYSLTINKAKLTPTWVLLNNEETTDSNKEYTYDGQKHGVGSVKFIANSGVDVSDINTKVEIACDPSSPNNKGKNVKHSPFKYTVSLPEEYQNNFEIVENKDTLTVTINPRPLTLSWDGNKANVIYNGKSRVPTPAIEGVVDGETVAYDLKDENNEIIDSGNVINVGTYTFNVVLKDTDGFLASNYDISSFASFTRTIKKRKINIDWENIVIDYDGDRHYPLASTANKIANADKDKLELSFITAPKIKPGIYTAEVSLHTPGIKKRPNYDFEREGRSAGIRWEHHIAADQDPVINNYELVNATKTYYIFDSDVDGKVSTGIMNSASKNDVKDIAIKSISEEKALTILAANADANEILQAYRDNDKKIHISTIVTSIDLNEPEYEEAKQVFEGIDLIEGTKPLLLDISLWASVDDDSKEPTKLTTTGGTNIEFKITLNPTQASELGIEGDGKDKIIKICRIHEGSFETLDGILNIDRETGDYYIIFETNKFSEYAIYTKKKPENNKKSSSWKAPVTGIN